MPGHTEGPLRFAVVGLGYWGPNLLRCLSQLPEAEVVVICDLEPARLDRYKRLYPGVAITTKYQDVLDDDSIDAVVIATPVRTHFDLAKRSIDAGKHTFVEKPLAPAGELAETLIFAAAERDVLLMCGHTFLYSPAVRKVGTLIDSGELGELFFVSSSRVNLGLHQRDVSVVWDLGPHDFSILLFWLGESPESVRATGRDSIVAGIYDVAFVTLTFPSGIVANVELSWLAPSKLRRTVVVGREKMVLYEDGAPESVKVYDHGVVYRDPETFGEFHLSYRTGDVLVPKIDNYEPLSTELADFIRQVRTDDHDASSTRLASEVVRITEAAEASVRKNGAEVSLKRPRRFVSGAHGVTAEGGLLLTHASTRS